MAIERNEVVMEACPSKSANDALMGEVCQCDYRIRLGESNQWYLLSSLTRNRVSVMDFSLIELI